MNWNKPQNKALVQAILTLKSADGAQRFLRDLLTKDEIEEFGKRLRTAQMLTQKIPYSVIEKETGLSSTTIARVSKWLKGKQGGYRRVISKLHHKTPIARGG